MEFAKGVFKIKYFPSVNSMYIYSHRQKCLDPECTEMRSYAFSQLAKTSFTYSVPEKVPLSLELGFFLTHSLGKRDLDNLLKFTIDTLSKYYQFNDNRVYSIKTYKRLLEGSSEEVLYYKIFQDKTARQKVNINDLR